MFSYWQKYVASRGNKFSGYQITQRFGFEHADNFLQPDMNRTRNKNKSPVTDFESLT